MKNREKVIDHDRRVILFQERHLYPRPQRMLRCGQMVPANLVYQNFHIDARKLTTDYYYKMGYAVVLNYNGREHLIMFNRVTV
jgi:hypothetical protein